MTSRKFGYFWNTLSHSRAFIARALHCKSLISLPQSWRHLWTTPWREKGSDRVCLRIKYFDRQKTRIKKSRKKNFFFPKIYDSRDEKLNEMERIIQNYQEKLDSVTSNYQVSLIVQPSFKILGSRLFSRGGQKFSKREGSREPTFCLKNQHRRYCFSQKSQKHTIFGRPEKGRAPLDPHLWTPLMILCKLV